jgi:hypothetical protein
MEAFKIVSKKRQRFFSYKISLHCLLVHRFLTEVPWRGSRAAFLNRRDESRYWDLRGF